ncbi:hypothetical protein CR513_56110, partial [Mucuna pruriens]
MNIGLLQIFKIRGRLPRQIELLIKESQHIVVDLYLHELITKNCYTATTVANCLGGGGENQKLKLKYEQQQQEVQKSTTEEATSANDSNSVPINDNDIYLEVVGGKNEKGNVYGLDKLTNKFMRSTRIPTNLIDMSMVQQMEEMREANYELNMNLWKKQLRRSHLRRK